jgi:hypothetical protein
LRAVAAGLTTFWATSFSCFSLGNPLNQRADKRHWRKLFFWGGVFCRISNAGKALSPSGAELSGNDRSRVRPQVSPESDIPPGLQRCSRLQRSKIIQSSGAKRNTGGFPDSTRDVLAVRLSR